MSQQQHQALTQVPNASPVQVVEVEGRTYQIVQVDPQAVAHHPPQPHYIQPQPIPRSSLWDDPRTVIFAGIGCVVLGGCIVWVVVKAFAPAPIPAPAPASPSTVIVQPPAPEKRPYSRRDCRPAGMFGWNEVCTEERGYE